MLVLRGMLILPLCYKWRWLLMNRCYREGAATLNDMKDMLASLPQYQEQREKVRGTISRGRSIVLTAYLDAASFHCI
jgi:hypothetical protein